LVPRLAERYAVIRLGGPHLGLISLLEARADSGYGDLFAHLLDRARPAAGETLLELGCGSGALSRGLARRTGGDCAIVATDINPYLLGEARTLADRDVLSSAIRFEEANAEVLPFSDARFDVAFCSTVFEEGDAGRMLAEMVRVTRPGGRIVVMTRALDIDWWVNLAVPDDLRRRLGAVGPSSGAGVGARGCADMSLYTRFGDAGLTPILTGPQFAVYRDGPRLDAVLDRLVSLLPPDDERLCRDAIRKSKPAGTLLAGEPFHCAVATR
jgi:SAM-dependent methyltransferase